MANRLTDLMGNQNTDYSTLAQLIALSQAQQQQGNQPRTVNVGGHNILDVTPRNRLEGMYPALQNLMLGFGGMQQMQKKNQFLQLAKSIAESTEPMETKQEKFLQLYMQDPEMGKSLGFDDIVTALEKRQPKEYKPTTQAEALAFEEAKAGIKKKEGKTLTAPMIDNLTKKESAIYTLKDSVTMLEANKDKFAQFMGPAKGPLRNPIRAYVNKDLQDFLGWTANVQDAFQQYRVAITGAQASDKEIKLLAKNRPTQEDSYEVFTNKAKEVQRIGNQVLSRYIKNMGRAGYDVSGYQELLDNLNAEMGGLTEEPGQPQSNANTQVPQAGQMFNGQKVLKVRRVK